MIRISIFVSMFLFWVTASTKGQVTAPIATDRPDQTECPFIVPKGYLQAEHGLTYEKISKTSRALTHPSILWKYGISENIEVRLITEIVSEKELSKPITGLVPITVGFKTKIAEENGLIPKVSFIGHLSVPNWASKALKTGYYAPSFRFTMQHTLSDKFALAYNLGAEWDGETPNPTFIYTLTTGYSITKKLGSYLEFYGFSPQNQSIEHRFDGGLTYLINQNIMVDISAGVGLTSNAPKNFISLGFSYRFNTQSRVLISEK
jgi:Putative MetA-pathway of phenol degradation